MVKNRALHILFCITALVILAVPLMSGCSGKTSYTVKTATKAGIGDYLVDTNGMTLYYWAKDVADKSNASASIVATWPVFYASSITVPSNLNTADFGTITRQDGSKQSTYHGWPLYRYSQDTSAGNTNGDGFGGLWFAQKVGFYSVMLLNNATLGTYLADKNGMTLYYFTKDSPGKSVADNTVIQKWPVFDPSSFTVPSLLNFSDFGTLVRDDGAKQATYKGFPLYYYVNDSVSGDTSGQAVGGVWFVIVPQTFSP